ncbi:hypothetical protein ACS0TY_030128 [Phlomoides rotata]
MGTYVGGSVYKFDHVNGSLFTLNYLRKFGDNCGFSEINRLFSCVEEGRFEHIADDASVKTIVHNALQGNRDLHIYFVINDGDGVDAVSQGVEGIEGSEQDDDSDDSEYMDETEEEEGTESDGVEGESSCEDDGINVDGSGESNVNESAEDFNS